MCCYLMPIMKAISFSRLTVFINIFLYSYSKTNQPTNQPDAPVSHTIYSCKTLYMFRMERPSETCTVFYKNK
jgi:hypothetical protein